MSITSACILARIEDITREIDKIIENTMAYVSLAWSFIKLVRYCNVIQITFAIGLLMVRRNHSWNISQGSDY